MADINAAALDGQRLQDRMKVFFPAVLSELPAITQRSGHEGWVRTVAVDPTNEWSRAQPKVSQGDE